METFGKFLNGAGQVVWIGAGIVGFFLSVGIIADVAGFWGVVASLILGPVTYVAAPLYAGFVLEDWLPFTLNYGGAVLAMVLVGLGTLFADE